MLGFSGAPGAGPEPNPWQNALDYWWQHASATLPAEQRSLVAELVRQSGAFLACAEFFAPLTRVLARQSAGEPVWDAQLRKQFETLQGQLVTGKVPPGMESLLGAWKLPDDLWRQTSTLFARLPEEFLRSGMGAASFHGDQASSADVLKRGSQLWQDYQQALSEYLRMLSGAAHSALEKLQQKLLAGTEVHSLRELYDLWVECGEKTFSEMMAGAEFAAAFARLVNTLSMFKLHTRQMIDAGLEAMDLPSTQALNTVQQREAGMRSELRATQARQQEDREALLRLQEELKTLRRSSSRKTAAPGSGSGA